MAIRAWNLLANGMGGMDWAGLPLVTELLGIEDPQQLVDRLMVIRRHNPKDSHGPGNAID